jgi:peptidoglycan/xylan/chitin deacetylase (PgdA/CDA1 family)
MMRDRSMLGKIRRNVSALLNRRPVPNTPQQPMLSFSFDDVPLSAVDRAACVLESAGARGTFYVCGRYASGDHDELAPYADWPSLQKLSANGHEIGCHTFGHRNVALMGARETGEQLDRNRQSFLDNSLPDPVSFAYPFGDISAAAKKRIDDRFVLLRGVKQGLIRKGSDLNAASAVAIEGNIAVEIALRWMEKAVREKGWLILFTHDVTEHPSPYGLTPDRFQQIVTQGVAMGFDIVTVAEGARRLID